MSVEIGQLTVNARIVSRSENNPSNVSNPEADDQQNELIQRCIDEVLRVLAEKRER